VQTRDLEPVLVLGIQGPEQVDTENDHAERYGRRTVKTQWDHDRHVWKFIPLSDRQTLYDLTAVSDDDALVCGEGMCDGPKVL
jgi:hypothetical protein